MEPFLQERLEQLWKVANESLFISTKLSQSYCMQMMMVSEVNGVSLGNQFYWNSCSHCGLLWIPSMTCSVRVWPYSKVKSSSSTGKGGKGRFMFLSRVMYNSSMEKSLSRKLKVKLNYMVYRCKGCNYFSVFDNFPLSIHLNTVIPMPMMISGSSIKSTTTTNTNTQQQDKKKLIQLQKILQSNNTKNNSSQKNQKDTSGLGDFLKGLK